MLDKYTLNDEGELVIDDASTKSQAKWKKIAIVTIALCIALILLIVIIILLIRSKPDNSNSKTSKGEIICTYDINSITKPTQIISTEYDDKNINFDISLDNKIIPFSKNVIFSSPGFQKVKFILYGDINMKNMFKEIDSLLSTEMTTTKKIKINTIESAFENCINFNFFNMTGFDTSPIKSLSKIFYNT